MNGRTTIFSLFLIASLFNVLKGDSVWEYDPYRVQVWISIDSSSSLDAVSKDVMLKDFATQIENAFGATCETHVTESPAHLSPLLFDDLRRVTLNDLQSDDLVLVIGKQNAGTIRTAQAAWEKLERIVLFPGPLRRIREEILLHASDKSLDGIGDKLQPFEGSMVELSSGLKDGTIPATLVNRSQADKLKEWGRQISVRFPWQVETIIKQHDKIMLANLRGTGEVFQFQIRELDCSMKVLGPVWTRQCNDWNILSRTMLFGFRDAFTPLCRIEQADAKTAQVRVRASGLTSNDENPALIHPGDVVVPMVKRSDRVGAEATLQSIPWTYIAITQGDRINMTGSVYSGVRGALQGRQNKRIQRLALVVKTPEMKTDLKLVAGVGVAEADPEKGKPIPGIAVYQRVPSQDGLEMLARSDWRGIIELPDSPLPEIEFERMGAKGDATQSGSSQSGGAQGDVAPKNDGATEPTEVSAKETKEPAQVEGSGQEATPSVPANAAAPTKKGIVKEKIRLNVPLYLYYVKNGDTVLARLPIVHGMQRVEVAELPDDARRLEAEALLKGLQNEIIDIVARRKILEMRIEKRIKEEKIPEAKIVLEDIRRLPTYEVMNEQLSRIEQQILNVDRGPISGGAKSRIDTMVDTTRQMMQKYLQANLVRQYEAKIGFN